MDKLINAIIRTQNPTAAGLDTRLEYLPDNPGINTLADAADAITAYNKKLIDALYDIVPAVKIQSAYYEMYGWNGVRAFEETARYAASRGLYVIADIKRNDIGSTADAYSTAYLGKTPLSGTDDNAFTVDSVTINAYLGSDGILPFTEKCAQTGKTAFALVKTSNPSSGELQDCALSDGTPVYCRMGDLVAEWGKGSVGSYGYSSLGAVVGATYPQQGAQLRLRLPSVFFLIPGYGAQGGSAEGLAGCFDGRGLGGIVNASRSILCAWKKHGGTPEKAARDEALRMRDDLASAILKKYNISRYGAELKG